jgi:hypothetical protein
MWESRRLTTPWASTACCWDSFTFASRISSFKKDEVNSLWNHADRHNFPVTCLRNFMQNWECVQSVLSSWILIDHTSCMISCRRLSLHTPCLFMQWFKLHVIMNLNSIETGFYFCEREMDKSNGFVPRRNVYCILGIVREQSFSIWEVLLISMTLCERNQATYCINVLSQRGN